jgi:hypothetical protein
LLRQDASAALLEAVHDLAEPLEADLRRLGVDPIVGVHGGRWPAITLARAEWCHDSDAGPLVIALECDKKVLNNRGDLQLYTAVVAPRTHPLVNDYSQAADGLATSLRAVLGRDWKSRLPRWPAWRYITAPEGGAWAVEDIVNQARSELLQLWAAASPSLDGIFGVPTQQRFI